MHFLSTWCHDFAATVLWQWRPPDSGTAMGRWAADAEAPDARAGLGMPRGALLYISSTDHSESKFYFLFCISFLWIYGTSPIWRSKLIYVVGFCKYLGKIQLQHLWKLKVEQSKNETMLLKMSSSTSKKNSQTLGDPDGAGSTLCETGTHRPSQLHWAPKAVTVHTAVKTEPWGSGVYAAV